TFERLATGVTFTGSKETNLTFNGTFEKGTLGAEEPSVWIPGKYSLHCKDTSRIAPKTFTVVGRVPGKGETRVSNEIPIPTGKVTAFRFFISDGPSLPPVGSRVYFGTLRGSADFINTEVTLTFDRPLDRAYTINLRCHYFTDRGGMLGKAEADLAIPAGATSRVLSVGLGNTDGKFWLPGVYYSECDSKGSYLGSAYF